MPLLLRRFTRERFWEGAACYLASWFALTPHPARSDGQGPIPFRIVVVGTLEDAKSVSSDLIGTVEDSRIYAVNSTGREELDASPRVLVQLRRVGQKRTGGKLETCPAIVNRY